MWAFVCKNVTIHVYGLQRVNINDNEDDTAENSQVLFTYDCYGEYILSLFPLPFGGGREETKVRDHLGDSGTNNNILLKVILNKEDSCGINLNYSGCGSVKGFRD